MLFQKAEDDSECHIQGLCTCKDYATFYPWNFIQNMSIHHNLSGETINTDCLKRDTSLTCVGDVIMFDGWKHMRYEARLECEKGTAFRRSLNILHYQIISKRLLEVC